MMTEIIGSMPNHLKTAIGAFIDGWNERCHPFIWTKTPDEIRTKAHRKKTSNTRH